MLENFPHEGVFPFPRGRNYSLVRERKWAKMGMWKKDDNG